MNKLSGKLILINFSLICALAFVLRPIIVEASEEKPKHIHVVFDNSESMSGVSNPDLANATYAMQVLLAMLDENDSVAIYSVSEFQMPWNPSINSDEIVMCDNEEKVKRVEGRELTDGNSIRKVVKDSVKDELAKNTYFSTVMNALIALNNEDTEAEKWLVVFTDGQYEEKGANSNKWKEYVSTVVNYLGSDNYSDIHIVHYSFKNNSYYKKGGQNGKVTYYPDTESDDKMLDTMIKIGNQIFSRKILKTSDEGKTYTFELEAPAKRLIVFAQQSIEENSYNNKMQITANFKAGEVKNVGVETIDDMDFNYQKKPRYMGELITYSNFKNNGLLDAGEYSVEVSNQKPDMLKVYYEPEIGIRLVLAAKYSDNIIYTFSNDDEQIRIPSGEYRIWAELYNPLTGEALKKEGEIETDAKYYLNVKDKNNINIIDDTSNNWEGEIGVGSYTFSATADIFTGLAQNITMQVEVIDSLRNIEADLIMPEDGINMEELGNVENAIILKMYNHGESLSEDYKKQVKIENIDMETSYYRYRIEESEEGWLLWPEINMRSNGSGEEPNGVKDIHLKITLKSEEMEMEPILLDAQVYFHGNPFAISFKSSWGEKINIFEYIFDYFGGNLYIEPLINGKEINWKITDLQEITPYMSGDEHTDFIVKLADDGKHWEVIPQFSLIDLFREEKKRKCEQSVSVSADLQRYGKEEHGIGNIDIEMEVSLLGLIGLIVMIILILYILIIRILKNIRKICLKNIKANVKLQQDPDISVTGKVTTCKIYNLFIPGKSKMKVYLNEIEGGENKKIIFKCRAGGVFVVDNFQECQLFSNIKINGVSIKNNSMYDLENELRIVVAKDSEKTIILYQN